MPPKLRGKGARQQANHPAFHARHVANNKLKDGVLPSDFTSDFVPRMSKAYSQLEEAYRREKARVVKDYALLEDLKSALREQEAIDDERAPLLEWLALAKEEQDWATATSLQNQLDLMPSAVSEKRLQGGASMGASQQESSHNTPTTTVGEYVVHLQTRLSSPSFEEAADAGEREDNNRGLPEEDSSTPSQDPATLDMSSSSTPTSTISVPLLPPTSPLPMPWPPLSAASSIADVLTVVQAGKSNASSIATLDDALRTKCKKGGGAQGDTSTDHTGDDNDDGGGEGGQGMVIDLLELGAFEKCGGGLRVWNALKDALTHHGQGHGMHRTVVWGGVGRNGHRSNDLFSLIGGTGGGGEGVAVVESGAVGGDKGGLRVAVSEEGNRVVAGCMATTAAAVRKVTLCVTADTVISSHSPEHRPHGVFPPDLPSDYAEGPNKQQQQDQHQHHQHQQSNEEAAAWSSWSSAVGIDGVLCAMVNAELLIQGIGAVSEIAAAVRSKRGQRTVKLSVPHKCEPWDCAAERSKAKVAGAGAGLVIAEATQAMKVSAAKGPALPPPASNVCVNIDHKGGSSGRSSSIRSSRSSGFNKGENHERYAVNAPSDDWAASEAAAEVAGPQQHKQQRSWMLSWEKFNNPKKEGHNSMMLIVGGAGLLVWLLCVALVKRLYRCSPYRGRGGGLGRGFLLGPAAGFSAGRSGLSSPSPALAAEKSTAVTATAKKAPRH